MLEALPWPKHLQKVPEYAGGHHERMDGKGYPRGLTKEQMSVQARLMAIADIFEALTARDRPYKRASRCRNPCASWAISAERAYRPGAVRCLHPQQGLFDLR
jgi:response regulator RpfG family c-di-GMP phosphodiesterase